MASAVFADSANPLLGKWVEKFPNGASMLTVFTDKTITSTPADTNGKPSGSAITANITYKSLGHDDKLGDGYNINFVSPDGKSDGPGIMAYVKTPDTLVLDFPGASTHNLSRVK